MEAMIEAKGLKRTYKARGKSIEAVRGIDLRVNKGEIVGFLGPNGAGKTTTLKMLCDPARAHRRQRNRGRQRSARRLGRGAAQDRLCQPGRIDLARGAGGRRDHEPRRALRHRSRDGQASADRSCSRRSISATCGIAPAARCRAGRSGGSISSWGSSTSRNWCFSMNRRPVSIRRAAPICGPTSARCATSWERRCFSPRTTWTRRTRFATASSSSTMAPSSPRARRPSSRSVCRAMRSR